MYYFTSDAHFNDQKTLEYEFHPFKTPKQFDQYVSEKDILSLMGKKKNFWNADKNLNMKID